MTPAWQVYGALEKIFIIPEQIYLSLAEKLKSAKKSEKLFENPLTLKQTHTHRHTGRSGYTKSEIISSHPSLYVFLH